MTFSGFMNGFAAVNTFVLSLCMIYLLLDYTIGRFKLIQGKEVVFGMQLKDVIFIAAAAFVILYFFDFYKPY